MSCSPPTGAIVSFTTDPVGVLCVPGLLVGDVLEVHFFFLATKKASRQNFTSIRSCWISDLGFFLLRFSVADWNSLAPVSFLLMGRWNSSQV